MTVMAETTFGVSYDGPALADGRMPVRDLAPALLALGELFTEASTTLHPDRPPVALDIHATNQGSFDVDLILRTVEGGWDAAEQLFGGDAASTLVNLKELIIGGSAGSVGLLKFIKWLRGRSIESEEEVEAPAEADGNPPEPGAVRIGIGDETIEVPHNVLDLYGKVSVRRNAREVIRPLAQDGIESFKTESNEVVTLSVGKDDLPAFEDAIEAPEEEEELRDTERETTLQITAINWDAKWRFSEGAEDSSFFATIEDSTFQDKIDKGKEAFRKGDLLECTLRTKQRKVGGRLKAEYEIVNVTQHVAAAEQLDIEQEADAPEPLEAA